MEILRDAAENVFDLLRRQQDRIRVRRSGHNPDEPVLSPTLLHTFTGVYVPVSFLPDSEHFVGGCYDGTVRKWRISDGREVGKAKGHGSRVSVVAMSGDGKTVASGGGDGKVVLWSIDTCEDLVESQGKHSDWVTSLSFAPDAQRVASGSFDGSIIVWSATTGEIVASVFRGKEDWVLSLAFSPAGDRIASCGFMGGVQICDSSSGEEILKIPALASVCWSPDGSQLICGTDNGTIEFIDSSNGARLATWRGHEGAIYSISVFQGGTWLTSASLDHTVRLWSTSTHQQLASLDHPNQAYDVSVSPNGRYIASGGFGSDSDHGVMHIWRLPDIDTTIQEVKEDPAASRPDASGSQSVPVNKDGPAKIASAEDATPEQDPRDEDDDPQDSARDQSNHTDRRASWESWMDMPAVPPSRVPADDGIYAHFFDEPLAFQSKERSDDCPGEPKKKSKQTGQYVFQQLKNLRNAVLPRDSPSDAISGPRTSSSEKLKDRIARIRRRTSLAPDNAEDPADAEAPTSEEETVETRRPKPTLVSYNRLRSVLAVASNDPPVEQKKYYYARRNGRLVPIEPPAPSTTQHQRRRRNPFSRTSRGNASAEGQSSSTTPTTSPSQGQPLNTGQEREEDFEVECACCGFSILARSL